MLATAVDQSGTSITAASSPTHRRGDAEAEQRGRDRQPGRHQRPERQHEHERRDRQADGLGGQLALLRGGDHLAAHLDAQPVLARRLAQRDQALAGGDGDAVGLLGQRQARDRDRPVARDLGGRGLADAVEPRRGREQRVGALLHRALSTPCVACQTTSTVSDERPGKRSLEQIARALGLGAGRRVVGGELARERAGGGEGGHERDDPGRQDDAAGGGTRGRRGGPSRLGRCGVGGWALTFTSQTLLRKLLTRQGWQVRVDLSTVAATIVHLMGMPQKKPFLAWYAMLQANTRLTERINAELEAEAGLPLSWFEVLAQLKWAPESCSPHGRARRRPAALPRRRHAPDRADGGRRARAARGPGQRPPRHLRAHHRQGARGVRARAPDPHRQGRRVLPRAPRRGGDRGAHPRDGEDPARARRRRALAARGPRGRARSRLPRLMADEAVLTEADGGVLLITLNRPDQRNAVNAAIANGVAAALDRLDDDDDLQVGILTGAGKGFSAGMDLKAFVAGESTFVEHRGFAGIVQGPPRKPIIAAIEGFAVAGGFEVALACDLIVAAKGARLGIPEVKRSLVAAGGALLRLPRRIPYHVAMEMALTGEPITAERAAEIRPRQPPHRAGRGGRRRARARRPDRRQRPARARRLEAHPRRGAGLEPRTSVAEAGRDLRPGVRLRGRARGRHRLRREARPGLARASRTPRPRASRARGGRSGGRGARRGRSPARCRARAGRRRPAATATGRAPTP